MTSILDTFDPKAARVIRTARLVMILIGALLVLWLLVSHGVLSVATNSSDTTITVATMDGETLSTGHGSLTAYLPVGNYIITAQKNGGAQRTLITVQPVIVTSIQLIPPEAKAIEPVTNGPMKDMSVTKNNLRYLSSDGFLSWVDTTSPTIHQNASTRFATIVWAKNGDGVGLVENPESVGIVAVSGTTITPLPLPVGVASETPLSIALTPDGVLYVTQDGVLYKRQGNGSYVPVTTVVDGSTLLSANGALVVLASPRSVEDTSESSNDNIRLIDAKGSAVATASVVMGESPTNFQSVSWSPDGSKVFLMSPDLNTLTETGLEKSGQLPENTANDPVWQDNTHIIYGSGNGVWLYDTETKLSSSYALFEDGTTVTQLFEDAAGNYLYAATALADGRPELYRIALKQQPANRLANQFAKISTLDDPLDNCRVYYMNVAQPFLVVQYATSTDGIDEDSFRKSYCESLAREALAPSGLSFDTVKHSTTILPRYIN